MSTPTSAGRRGGNQNVYQIDFTAVASGKRIANTKRRVRWRFGFTNLQALENGETGTSCRGEEHDITLIWSVTSGKRLVLADGQEVHYSNSRGNTFEFSWTMRGNHVLKMIAHASAPISASNNFRQYDFFIDGQSFFSFPKVYRLGLSGREKGGGNQVVSYADRGSSYRNYDLDGGNQDKGTIAAIEAPHNEDEEEAYLAAAIKNSLADSKPVAGGSIASAPAPTALPIASMPAPAPAATDDLLLDFFSEPAAAAPAAPLALPPSNPPAAQYNYPPAAPAFAAPPPAPQLQQQSFTQPPPQPSPPQPQQQSFAQPPPQYQPSPFDAPPPTNYQPAPAQPTPPPPAAYTQPPAASDPFAPPPSGSFTQPYTAPSDPFAPQEAKPQPPNPLNLYTAPPPASNEPAPAPLTMNSLQDSTDKLSGSNADQAYSKLLNGFTLESKNDATKQNPFDSTTLGPQPTLAGLQNNKPPKKEVMSSAVVVSGTQSGNWGGYGQQYPPQGQGYNHPPPPFQGQGYNPNNSYQYPPPQQAQYPPTQQPQQPPPPNQYQNYQQYGARNM